MPRPGDVLRFRGVTVMRLAAPPRHRLSRRSDDSPVLRRQFYQESADTNDSLRHTFVEPGGGFASFPKRTTNGFGNRNSRTRPRAKLQYTSGSHRRFAGICRGNVRSFSERSLARSGPRERCRRSESRTTFLNARVVSDPVRCGERGFGGPRPMKCSDTATQFFLRFPDRGYQKTLQVLVICVRAAGWGRAGAIWHRPLCREIRAAAASETLWILPRSRALDPVHNRSARSVYRWAASNESATPSAPPCQNRKPTMPIK